MFTLTPTMVTLAASATTVAPGQAITLTATVVTVPAGPSLGAGTVTFEDDGAPLGTAPVSAGAAVLDSVVLSNAGVNSLSAAYSGSAARNIAGSTTAVGPNSLIQIVAGTTMMPGDSGPGSAAEFASPGAVVVDSAGDIFVADTAHNVIREINGATGVVNTYAGIGLAGYSGDGGPASAAELNRPAALALDSAGDLFIADDYNFSIREVNAVTKVITTVAGNGTQGGFSAGAATATALGTVQAVAVDSSGDLFISISNLDCVVEVNHLTGMVAPVAGIPSYGGSGTFSGDPVATATEIDGPAGLALDTSGRLFIADEWSYHVYELNLTTGHIETIAGDGTKGYSGDGGQATAAELNWPDGIALDSAGNLYIADSGNNRIRELNLASGVITTVAGNGQAGFSGDGAAASAASFNNPLGITVAANGDLLIADSENNRIREISQASGMLATIAGNGLSNFSGDGGPATAAALDNPWMVAVDSAGDLFIADSANQVVREVNSATGTIMTVAGAAQGGVSADSVPATTAALGIVNGIALDSAGDLFIDDDLADGEGLIREVNHATGIITTVAVTGTPGNPGPTTAGELLNPQGIALDSAGDIYFSNGAIFAVQAATGTTNIVVPTGPQATSLPLNLPQGVAVDSAGDLFVADQGNLLVREIQATTGLISTIAGNPNVSSNTGDGGQATAAGLAYPVGVALDSSGDVFISAGKIREVDANTGVITTIAGGGANPAGGIGGPATAAAFESPGSVAFDAAGDMFIPDSGDNRVLEVVAGVQVTVVGTAPMSSVDPLGYRTSNTSIPVSWAGTPGSGGPIMQYTILVSTDGGAFAPWLTNTTATSAVFTAQTGHTYGFISQATDAAGKTEAMHSIADTTVTVMAMPWQNPGNPLDVLGTGGAIVPADVLAIIDYLNLHPGVSSLPATAPGNADYYDVLGDNSVVPADALAVIDYLNLHPASSDIQPAATGPAAVTTASDAIGTDSPIADHPGVSPAVLAVDAPSAGAEFAPPVSPAAMAVASASNVASVAPPMPAAQNSVDASTTGGSLPGLKKSTLDEAATDELFSATAVSWWDGS